MANRFWNPSADANWGDANVWATTFNGDPTGVATPTQNDDCFFTATNSYLDTADGAGTFTLHGTGTYLSCDWLDIRRSTVDASPHWYAGTNSLNTASNTNWIFTGVPISSPSTSDKNYISNSISI